MITSASLRASLYRELRHAALIALRVLVRSLFPILFGVLVLADGLVMRNAKQWSAEPRAWLVTGVFMFGVLMLAWHRVTLDLAAALVIGAGAALLVSQSFHTYSQPDLTLWVIFAGTLLWQRSIKRDWSSDMARAGWAVALIALVMCVGNALGISTPNGAWNRNVMAGVLAALLPAAIVHTSGGGHRLTQVTGVMAMAAALIALGSRGGILGAAAALIVFAGPQNNLTRRPWRAIAICAALIVLGALMMFVRPGTSLVRVEYFRQAVSEWMNSSPTFGVGPGNLYITTTGAAPIDQAHNVLVTLAATTGIMGAVVIGVTLTLCKLKFPAWKLWEWGTLAALFTHAMVDDPFTWLPTVLIAGVVLGGSNANRVADSV